MLNKMIAILTLSLVSSFALATGAQTPSVPACTPYNEGQTLLLEGDVSGPIVYVCRSGNWVPATYAR